MNKVALNQFVNKGTDALLSQKLMKSETTYGPDDFEKRTIKIAGHPATLDKIEAMLGYMAALGSKGHSTEFKVWVDGDGGFSCRCSDEKGKELSKKHSDWIQSKADEDGDVKHFGFD